MLSLFPSLYTYTPIAPLLLRVLLGVILLFWAQRRLRHHENSTKTALGVLEAVTGFLLVIGLYTQGAALVALIVFLVKIISKIRAKAFFTGGINYYFILFIIALALLFLGPGALSFDLPL